MKSTRKHGVTFAAFVVLFAFATGAVARGESEAASGLVDLVLSRIQSNFAASLDGAPTRYFYEEGIFRFFDVETCFAQAHPCFGNNPDTPYGFPMFPPRRGETANFNFKLGKTEAVVMLGLTPPDARYFGLTSYVYSRQDRQDPDKRMVVFGSISDTINMDRIGVHSIGPGSDDPHNRITAFVFTPNTEVEDEMRALLTSAGLDPEAINVFPIPTVSDEFPLVLGYGDDADDFTMLIRVGFPTDQDELDAYIAAAPFAVWRVGVRDSAFGGYPWEPYIERTTGITERDLLPGVDARLEDLATALQRRHAGLTPKVVRDPIVPLKTGHQCINLHIYCSSDSQDSALTFDANGFPHRLIDDPDNFWYVLGVNHTYTGKTVYFNHSVYRMDISGGIGSISDVSAPGSAAYYAEAYSDGLDIGDFDDFYVYKIARACDATEKELGYCYEVPYPTPAAPVGAEDDDDLTLVGRLYVDQTSGVGPDKDELVLPMMLIYE